MLSESPERRAGEIIEKALAIWNNDPMNWCRFRLRESYINNNGETITQKCMNCVLTEAYLGAEIKDSFEVWNNKAIELKLAREEILKQAGINGSSVYKICDLNNDKDFSFIVRTMEKARAALFSLNPHSKGVAK